MLARTSFCTLFRIPQNCTTLTLASNLMPYHLDCGPWICIATTLLHIRKILVYHLRANVRRWNRFTCFFLFIYSFCSIDAKANTHWCMLSVEKVKVFTMFLLTFGRVFKIGSVSFTCVLLIFFAFKFLCKIGSWCGRKTCTPFYWSMI